MLKIIIELIIDLDKHGIQLSHRLHVRVFSSYLIYLPYLESFLVMQTNPEMRHYANYGLDLVNGVLRDNVSAGVLEPALSKVKSIQASHTLWHTLWRRFLSKLTQQFGMCMMQGRIPLTILIL